MTETTAPATTLDDITRPGFIADPDEPALRCRGINHRDHGRPGVCGACGAEVAAREGKGRGYAPVAFVEGYRKFFCWGRHECAPDRVAAHRRAVLADLGCGVLAPRYPARVVKGRKVPVGTTGVITWFGEGTHGARVGLRDAAGTVHWTAAANVVLDLGAGLAAEVTAYQAELAQAIADERAQAERIAVHEAAMAQQRHDLAVLIEGGVELVGREVVLIERDAVVGPDTPRVTITAQHRKGTDYVLVTELADGTELWLGRAHHGLVWRLA